MIIDSKGKLFGKISIIDILVLVIIVGGIAGVSYKFMKSRTLSPFAKGVTIVTQFYQAEIDEFAAKSIKVGDMVTDHSTGANFGKVTNIEIGKSASFASDDKGVWVESPKPRYASVTITVEGSGIYKDGVGEQGVSFGSTDFYVDRSVDVQVGNVNFWAKVYSLQKKG